MGKKLLVSVILIAFLAGSLVTGSIAFGEDGLTKLQKQCAKEPKTPQKIKPDCELLAMINALVLLPGPQGEQGEQGEKGETGEQGESGSSASPESIHGKIFTLDLQGTTSTDTSIAIGTDNFPVISYPVLISNNLRLKLIHCTSVDCSTFNAPVELDQMLRQARNSIAIGSDNFPAIAYIDESPIGGSAVLKFVHCTNVDCSTFDSPITLVSSGWIQISTSMAIGTDGFPIIIYSNFISSALELYLIHCTSVDCSTADPIVPLDTRDTGAVSAAAKSIRIGTDTFPVISYTDNSSGFLKFIHCTSIDCSTFDAPFAVSSPSGTKIKSNNLSNLIIGSDGFPAILYRQSSNMNFIHCTSIDCTSTEFPVLIAKSARLERDSEGMALGSDNFPVIIFEKNNKLNFVKCNDVSCLETGRFVSLVEEVEEGSGESMTITSDGTPIISYNSRDNLKIVLPGSLAFS